MATVTYEHNEQHGTVEAIYTDDSGAKHIFAEAVYDAKREKVYFNTYFPSTIYANECLEGEGNICDIMRAEVMKHQSI